MKSKYLCVLLFMLTFLVSTYADNLNNQSNQDTLNIINLNKQAYNNRLTNPNETVEQAKRILSLAKKIDFKNGIAESNRIIGIGYDYLSQPDTALSYYLKALDVFKSIPNQNGQARVDNNIGNLYKESDYEKSIQYFQESLQIATKVHDEKLIGLVYLNIGNIYYRKKNFTLALDYYNRSNAIFIKSKDTVNLIQCLQNKGVIYYNRNSIDTAESLLLEANKQAKVKDLNTAVAGINLTLVSLYKDKKEFAKAEEYLREGLFFAEQVKSSKLIYDYKLTKYELEFKRNDYKAALFSLRDLYKLDSVKYKKNESVNLTLLNEQYNNTVNQQRNAILLADKKKQQILFWSSSLVAALLLVLIFVLISNVNRKAKTNLHLTELNQKITEQKENLNQINHHLEEIIDERTKDLQAKNKKLSDYSLHLSHQIRGPIATLKGLLNLEKDKLIEEAECIKLMNKCVSEIDDNIIDMSGMLHESTKGKK